MSSPGEDVDGVSELLERRVAYLNNEIVGIRTFSLIVISCFTFCWYVTNEAHSISLVGLLLINISAWVLMTLLRSSLVLYLKYGAPSYRMRQYLVLPIVLNTKLDLSRIRPFVESNAFEFTIRPGSVARIVSKWNKMVEDEVDLFYI